MRLSVVSKPVKHVPPATNPPGERVSGRLLLSSVALMMSTCQSLNSWSLKLSHASMYMYMYSFTFCCFSISSCSAKLQYTSVHYVTTWIISTDLQEMQMTGLLLKHFKLQEFRDWQVDIIKATLERRNTFVLQRTGSGKSLCFQFPSLVTKKLTVVLTPTISLMNDQTRALQAKGIRATHLGSIGQ